MAPVSPGFEWPYVAVFLHRGRRRSSYGQLSGVDAPVFNLLLEAFAAHTPLHG